MAVSVTQISRMAGCSVATVSRVLNNSGAVSPEKRDAIHRAMRQTQYLARRGRRREVRQGERGVVEIVHLRHTPIERLSLDGDHLEVGPLSGYPRSPQALAASYGLGISFYRQILDGAIQELEDWGFRAQLRLCDDLLDPSFLGDINQQDRSGILLLGEQNTHLSDFIDKCLHPLVLIDLLHEGVPDVVTIDNLRGVSAALEHLFELGHTQIGFVGKYDPNPAFTERYDAFHFRMTRQGLAVRPEWVHEGPNHIEPTAAGMMRILSAAQRPTALVCANDCYALGAVRAAANLQIAIPTQLSIVGFDDLEYSTLVTPPLTTVHVPLNELGRQGVRQLMVEMRPGAVRKRRGCRVRVLPDLVVRQSTAACAST